MSDRCAANKLCTHRPEFGFEALASRVGRPFFFAHFAYER